MLCSPDNYTDRRIAYKIRTELHIRVTSGVRRCIMYVAVHMDAAMASSQLNIRLYSLTKRSR